MGDADLRQRLHDAAYRGLLGASGARERGHLGPNLDARRSDSSVLSVKTIVGASDVSVYQRLLPARS